MDFEFVLNTGPEHYWTVAWGIMIAVILLCILYGVVVGVKENELLPATFGMAGIGVLISVCLLLLAACIWFFISGAGDAVDQEQTSARLAVSIEEEYGVELAPGTVLPLLEGLDGADTGGNVAQSEERIEAIWGDEVARIALAWHGDEWIIIDADAGGYVEMEGVN